MAEKGECAEVNRLLNMLSRQIGPPHYAWLKFSVRVKPESAGKANELLLGFINNLGDKARNTLKYFVAPGGKGYIAVRWRDFELTLAVYGQYGNAEFKGNYRRLYEIMRLFNAKLTYTGFEIGDIVWEVSEAVEVHPYTAWLGMMMVFIHWGY